MPVKIMIEADNVDMVQAMLIGMTRAVAAETSRPVLSDQAPSDIVQHPELPFEKGIEAWVDEAAEANAPLVEPTPEPAPEPKKRGRPPKAAKPPSPVLVEDVEPPAEVVTEEEEPEAEGAVDAPEPEPVPAGGVTYDQLRDTVREIMDNKGIPVTLELLAEAGYRHVKEIAPADFDRVHAILTRKA